MCRHRPRQSAKVAQMPKGSEAKRWSVVRRLLLVFFDFLIILQFAPIEPATADAQGLLARPGQTVALGVIGASVYYDETGGTFRLIATISELPGIPIRLVATLQPGQVLTISVPAQSGKLVTEVRLTHTQGGLDISYLTPVSN
jgi:hypothetical protein